MAERLTHEQIEEGLEGSGWSRDGDSIVRDFELKDFVSAMAFVNAVAEIAEGVNHHPDILIHHWNKVRLTLWTHTVGGVTQSDFDLSRGIDGLSGG